MRALQLVADRRISTARCSSTTPAKALQHEELRTLKIGSIGDASVLDQVGA